jgi:hypothetical protein
MFPHEMRKPPASPFRARRFPIANSGRFDRWRYTSGDDTRRGRDELAGGTKREAEAGATVRSARCTRADRLEIGGDRNVTSAGPGWPETRLEC